MADPLSALWSAGCIAVVGASENPTALGRLPMEFLDRYGYRGTVVPVRPDRAPVRGIPSVTSVAEAPEQVDLAMVMVGADRVPAAVDDCATAGVPVVIVCSSGFAETGQRGARLQEELVRRARAHGTRVVGPNCIGSVGVRNAQVTSFSPLFSGADTRLVDGTLGFVSQSGALGYGAVSLAFERGLGLGWVVNTGNEADVNAVEVMAAMAAEPDCTGLLAYVESLDDMDGLRAVAATGLPVALLKAGRSDAGAKAAASHTGALAAGDRVVDSALRQLGMVRADDVEDLLDIGDAFSQPRRPRGPRVAVVTTSGGSGILAADAVEAAGLRMAALSSKTRAVLDEVVPAFGSGENPVDVTATVMSDSTLFDRALHAIVDDDEVDLVVACFCVLTGKDVADVVSSLEGAALRSGKPVLAARTGADHLAPGAAAQLRAAGIPTYPTPARAVRAAAALHRVTAHRPRPLARSTSGPATAAPPADTDERALKDLLGAAGLPVPAGRLAASATDARDAVSEFGGTAVLKAVVPGLVHKSEAGGVLVGVTADEAEGAYRRLAALGGGVLVEEHVTGGVEALVGTAPSPLGPVLTVGPGGVLTELIDDVALRVLPVDERDVEEMIDETRLGAMLAGIRGAPPADRRALVRTVLDVADLVTGWPAGSALDLNPVSVLPEGSGVRILDAAYVASEEH